MKVILENFTYKGKYYNEFRCNIETVSSGSDIDHLSEAVKTALDILEDESRRAFA